MTGVKTSTSFGVLPYFLLAAVAGAQPVAPNFRAIAADDEKPRVLAAEKGKVVILEWTHPDCPFVEKFYSGKGVMQNLQRRAAEKDVVWWTIHSLPEDDIGFRTMAEIRTERKESGTASAASLYDPNGVLSTAYGIERAPTIVVVRPDGRVLYKGGMDTIRGWDPDDLPKVKNKVREILDALDSPVPVSIEPAKPYGCRLRPAPSAPPLSPPVSGAPGE